MKWIRVKKDLCTGCGTCEIVCSSGHVNIYNPAQARIRVFRDDENGISYPTVCTQCPAQLCIKKSQCPVEALALDSNGMVIIDQDRCKLHPECPPKFGEKEFCVAACPFEGIFIDLVEKVAIKCDLCSGDPACFRWCAPEALILSKRKE